MSRRHALLLSSFLVVPVEESTDGGVTGYYSHSITALGDVDGDGYQDLSIGGYRVADNGTAWLMLGGAEGEAFFFGVPAPLPADAADITLEGTANDGEFGAALDLRGDVDGDGFDDLLVGVPGAVTRRPTPPACGRTVGRLSESL